MATVTTDPQIEVHATVRNTEQVRGLRTAYPCSMSNGGLVDVVLLAGCVQPALFGEHVGRPIVQLPFDASRALLDVWWDEVGEMARLGSMDRRSMRVLQDRGLGDRDTSSTFTSTAARPGLRIEQDRSRLRGTAGVLRDSAYRHYDDDDFILVAHAAQVLLEPLHDLVNTLRSQGSDVGIFAHLDGTPSGIMLLRVGCLSHVAEIGYVDLKEQALPRIALHHTVTVFHRSRPVSLSVRTMGSYIGALRQRPGLRGATREGFEPYAEEWRPSFGIIEPQANVDPSAHVLDSVVLNGGRVGRGALVVRSVVCPGGVVKPNETIIDTLVKRTSRRS